MIFILLSGCLKYGPIHTKHNQLITHIEESMVDDYAKKCAPKEFALANAQKEFAELEFEQGDLLRAEDHLDIAIKNIQISIEAAKACRPQDTDKDGVYDDVDQCINDKETINNYKDEDGCPELDSDSDGILDELDQCIDDPEDIDKWEDEDGCPDIDNDKDGILDVDEPPHCRNLPEDFDNDKDTDGCPEEDGDSDSDGILDAQDKCVNDPETMNNYLDYDGCPDSPPSKVRIEGNQIVIEEKIYFANNKAIILEQSYGILNSVAEVLRTDPKIHIEIQGHTDSVGSDKYNMDLSQRRANSVRTHLINKEGIDGKRLEAKGFGERNKIVDPERTPEDKERNRRVEFRILEGE